MHYIFYDFETTGRSSTWDQIIQVGAIIVDSEFNAVEQPYESRCGLRPGVVPEPAALLVNKTSSSELELNESNISHYNFINLMLEKFVNWVEKYESIIFVGYNTIPFDEEFMRQAFFQLLHPPYFTQMNGNQRADILGIIRCVNIYYPGSIKTTINNKGNSVFKLDQIAPQNDIEHLAHDALGDVKATIEIAKIIKKNAPELWMMSMTTTSKVGVGELVRRMNFFLLSEFYFGKTKILAVTYICDHPDYKWPQCFDLKNDPNDYIGMTDELLKEHLKKAPKIIRSVVNNKHPIIMGKDFLDKVPEYSEIGFQELERRSTVLLSNKGFIAQVKRILTDLSREKKEAKELDQSQLYREPEARLYSDGFATFKDNKIMKTFHSSENWIERFKLSEQFENLNLRQLAKRIIYDESPQSLPVGIVEEIRTLLSQRILSENEESWNTIRKANDEIHRLREKYFEEDDEESLFRLDDIEKLIKEIELKHKDD